VINTELESFSRLARTEYVSPLEFASRYALLGQKDQAFIWLEKAVAERTPQLFNLNVDPDYENLRNDPRFVEMVSRIGLPQ
jgi:hypothetical protein